MFRKLLEHIGAGTTVDAKILDGLDEDFEFDEDGESQNIDGTSCR